MLSTARKEYISSFIDEMKDIEQNGDIDQKYEVLAKADKIFGDELPNLSLCYRECCSYEGMLPQNIRIAIAILEEYLVRNQEDSSIYSENLKALKRYKVAYRHYKNGLAKYQDGIFERNTLDDMRAALEALVREITGKDKTLENQMSIVCTMLDEAGAKSEIRNLFQKTIDYYTKYQNNYVKHNDGVEPAEVSFVIEWTGVLMKYIISILG